MNLDEALEEVRRALDAGEIGYDGLYSPEKQSNFRNAWTQLYWEVRQKMNAGEHDKYAWLAIRMGQLIDEAPPAPQPSTVNTTRYGSENELGR